jgi:hypothetical protein
MRVPARLIHATREIHRAGSTDLGRSPSHARFGSAPSRQAFHFVQRANRGETFPRGDQRIGTIWRR